MNSKLKQQLSVGSWGLIVIFLLSLFAWWFGSSISPAKATTANLHLFWTGADAPSGWTIVSDFGGEDFFQKFLKGAASYSAGSGATTHTHTYTATVQETGSVGRGTKAGITLNALNHASGHSAVDSSITAGASLPPYRNLKVIEYTTGGVPTSIPAGAIAIFDASAPTGWTSISGVGGNYNTKFPRAAEDATSTGGATSHTHTMSTASISAAGAGTYGVNGTGTVAADGLHTHAITTNTVDTLSRDNLPPYIDVVLASKDSAGAIPAGMIGWFDAAVAYGWTDLSTSGAFNGKYIRGNTSYDATGGGALTHNHTAVSPEEDVYVVSDVPSAFTITGSLSTEAAWGGHLHAVVYSSFSNSNHEPPYINVIFAKKVDVYLPQSNNWRWYADEEDEAPGTAYEAENTAPPQIEMGKSIGFKLRVNFTEAGAVAGNNSRKNIQYSTSTSGPWVAVGSTSDTDKLFRYYDGGGNDNDTLSSVVLTGSAPLAIGIHNESSSANPSNADQPASTTVEFEYSIENYNAATGTLYYFSFNDETAGQVDLASGKSYPSLTTASVYDLTISAPATVDLGSWAIGSSAYASYTFVTNEEITIRDNRGQTSGNSSGWSATADITTALKYVATPSSISNPVFTGSGLDDMTINADANFTGSVTTYYKIEIDGTSFFDTFKWSDDDGSTWDATGVPCLRHAILNNGVFIDFGAPTGHTLGDYWRFTATPEVSYTISKANMYFITNTITGLYDAATTGITGNNGEYMSSAVTAALVSGSGKQGLGGFQFKPTLRMYNASTPGIYSGVITFTLT